MSYKPRSLFRLIEECNHHLFLPHIQRPFVWTDDQIIKLFDSLMRNYPIQTFLFWRTKDAIRARKFMEQVDRFAELSDLYDLGISAEGVEKTFVLDGQQRLQSLYTLFKGGTIQADTGSLAYAYFDVTSGLATPDDDLRYPILFSSTPLPLPAYRLADLLGKDNQKNSEEISDRLNDALDEALEESSDARGLRHKRVRKNVSQLVSLLREEKHFWVQQLDGVASSYDYRTILNIFVRVNSGGTKLGASDLMFAAMKEGWTDVEQEVEEIVEILSGTQLQFDKTFVLKCLLVAHNRGAETGPSKFTGDVLEELEGDWPRAEEAFRQLRDFMFQDLKLVSDNLIRTYNSFVPLFDYLFHNPKVTEGDRALMAGYHYKAQMFGWFSRGTDSVINSLHSIVGKPIPRFPIDAIKTFFGGRSEDTELSSQHLHETRLRFILLNLVYADRFGNAPFDVRFKGNEPHVDHIYPHKHT